MVRVFLYYVVLFLVVGSSRLLAAETTVIKMGDNTQSSLVAPSSYVLVDPSATMGFTEVETAWEEGRFRRETQDLPNYGFQPSAFWYRFSVHNTSRHQKVWYFGLENSVVNSMDVYSKGLGGAWIHTQSGSLVEFARRDIKNRYFYLKFTFAPNETRDFYVRFHTQGSAEFQMYLRGLDDIYRMEHDTQFYLGATLGLLLILAAYYILLAWHSRQSDLFMHGFFLLSFFIFRMSVMGFGYEYLWPGSPVWNRIIVSTSVPLVFLMALCNAYFFLPMQDYPRLRMIVRLFLLANFSLLITAPFLPYKAIKFHVIVGIITTLLIILSSLYSHLGGFRPARFFVYAWSGLLISAFMLGLQKLGLIPVSFFSTYGAEVATVALVVLLSLGVSDKINAVNKALHRAQADALETQIETNRLQLVAQQADQRALAEQLRLNTLKDQFLANTSHELRTPLNGVMGMAEAILLRKNLNERDQDDLRSILDASQRLTRLVGDILDFSALQDGALDMGLVDLNAEKMMRETLGQLKGLVQDKKIDFQLLFPGDGTWVEANADHMAKVFDAILSNAIKFTEAGLISIHGRILDDTVEIAIADRGIGIAPEKLRNIEAAFEQGDGRTTRKQGGTGLGLAFASRLMKAQSGSLKVHSQLGVGTTVIMSFKKGVKEAEALDTPAANPSHVVPLLLPESTPQALAVGQSSRAAYSKSQSRSSSVIPMTKPLTFLTQVKDKPLPRILVVDDDALNLRVLRSHLAHRQFQVEFAKSGSEALDKVREQGRVDLILLDVMMPGMSGYDVCRELRKTFEPSELPILMLTAKNQAQDIVDGFEAGANDYIQKPFNHTELHARIDLHLKLGLTTQAMKRFVPEDFIRLLGHEHFADVSLGDAAERRLTIIFADIRGFTKAVEFMQTPEVFRYLNNCFAVLGPEIRKAGGFIDKYIGDAIMALFPSDPDDAIRSAVAMNEGLKALNQDFWLGTGIHIGPTMLGTLGESERFEATALSDAVNVTSRLEGLTKLLDTRVLVSKDCRDAMKRAEDWRWRDLGDVLIRGRDQAIHLYELVDVDPHKDALIPMIQEFEQGVKAFKEGQFKQAMLHFQHVLREVPGDGPSRFYVKKAEFLIDHPQAFHGVLDVSDVR
ncbi:MAG TPA: response regulator [Oligoflexus sp.]|uniref:response regulator n=1 Tax=Oligoflexus sp. TaxID=1971216 RepID=UPI002D313F69|nr:response regulator [Oligoflexus sp.]HYX37783.1 response regulator [Oligoflexus sp.]